MKEAVRETYLKWNYNFWNDTPFFFFFCKDTVKLQFLCVDAPLKLGSVAEFEDMRVPQQYWLLMV